jgi:hypothetical protein
MPTESPILLTEKASRYPPFPLEEGISMTITVDRLVQVTVSQTLGSATATTVRINRDDGGGQRALQ